MRLSTFIDENVEAVLQLWEDLARTIIVSSNAMDADALADIANH